MVLVMEKRGLVLVLGMMVQLALHNVQVSNAAVYHIGGSAGWTIIGNINYQKLADFNTYYVGDILIFSYSPIYHNVMEVTNAAYTSCDASYPIAIYATGNDSISLTTGGHHYFLCGFPSHCQIGQKVDISVLQTSMGPTLSPSPAESPAESAAESPAESAAESPAESPAESAAESPAENVAIYPSDKAAIVHASTTLFSKLGLMIFLFVGFYV